MEEEVGKKCPSYDLKFLIDSPTILLNYTVREDVASAVCKSNGLISNLTFV